MVDGPLLASMATRALAGTAGPGELLAALLEATVFCQAPERPGVLVSETGQGLVVRVFSGLPELLASQGPVAWFSTSGLDLMQLLPAGHDLVLDLGSDHAVRLRSAAVRTGLRISR